LVEREKKARTRVEKIRRRRRVWRRKAVGASALGVRLERDEPLWPD